MMDEKRLCAIEQYANGPDREDILELIVAFRWERRIHLFLRAKLQKLGHAVIDADPDNEFVKLQSEVKRLQAQSETYKAECEKLRVVRKAAEELRFNMYAAMNTATQRYFGNKVEPGDHIDVSVKELWAALDCCVKEEVS